MIQSTTSAVNCLTINLLSFTIPPSVILETDQLRVKAKTFPDGNKQKFDIKAKKMSNCNLIFTLNITDQTEKLLFIFRKKTFLSGNQTIGTSEINISELMGSSPDNNSLGTQTLDIYYPVERQLREQQSHGVDRSSIKEKVIGQMKITISLSESFATDQNNKDQKKKTRRGSKLSNTNTDNLI